MKYGLDVTCVIGGLTNMRTMSGSLLSNKTCLSCFSTLFHLNHLISDDSSGLLKLPVATKFFLHVEPKVYECT